ncbi:MAG: ATP-dependent zinc protease [Gammaproteobacteria bacterium]
MSATQTLGWREWVSLPDLGIDRIKAKVDTGARTSALHAFDVRLEDGEDQPMVRFSVHPKQRNNDEVIQCLAPLLDERAVRDSGGHSEDRYVIETQIQIGPLIHTVEMTLTNRDNMGFRMLLGRTAMAGNYQVDPGRSYLMGK